MLLQFEGFREDCIAELNERETDALQKWSFETLYRAVVIIMNRDQERRGKGYPRNCTAIEAACLDVVRGEIYRARRVELWELEQSRKNR